MMLDDYLLHSDYLFTVIFWIIDEIHILVDDGISFSVIWIELIMIIVAKKSLFDISIVFLVISNKVTNKV